MISDSQTNTIYFSELLKSEKRYAKLYDELCSILSETDVNRELICSTSDIWVRDFMPIQISETKFLEYRYDPDYLQGNSDKKNSRELKSYPDIICSEMGIKTIKSKLIIDGGNVVKSEHKLIMCDKVIWENRRNFTKKELVSELHKTFEVDNVVLIPWDKGCVYGHADGMLRFIDTDTVLISGFYEQMNEQFKNELLQSLEQANINHKWLRCSPKEKDENITYINFLQTKDVIIIPSLGQNEDVAAYAEISKLFPQYNAIYQIDVTPISKMGGALNCISWTVKK